LQIFLKIISKFYYLAVEIRNFFYKIGIFKSYKLNAKIISVGNITWGGTGKTSFVSFLAKKLAENNQKVAILIRGYKRKEKGMITIEDNGKGTNWQKVGDEAYLLASQLNSVPIIVGQDRVKSGKEAIDKYSADFLILDDGFQHKKLIKDIDIVMIDAQDPFGNEKLIPAGKLREPIGSIKMADILVLNRAKQAGDKRGLISKLREHNFYAHIIETEYMVEKIYNLKDENFILPTEIKDKKILGFCGIGNPLGFKRTLKDLEVKITDFIVFPDHHIYKNKDVQRIQKQALDKESELILTTEKDKIRLPVLKDFKVPIYIIKTESKIISGETKLWDMIYGEGIDKN